MTRANRDTSRFHNGRTQIRQPWQDSTATPRKVPPPPPQYADKDGNPVTKTQWYKLTSEDRGQRPWVV